MMFSIYVAATPEIRDVLVPFLQTQPQVLMMGSSSDAEAALRDLDRDRPGVLLIDDRWLAAHGAAVEPLADRAFPIVLLADPTVPEAARRALRLRAKDLVPTERWTAELLPSLERVAIPLYPRDKRRGRIVTVFSPKGGVGKTTLSVNLAAGLAEKTHESVVIVDLDLAFGDVSSMLGLDPKTTIHDCLHDGLSAREALTVVSPHLSVLAAPFAPDEAEDISGPLLVNLLERLREEHAYVVVDLAPGYQETNLAALDVSDTVFTVLTPDVVTLRTIGHALTVFRKDLHYPPGKVRLVLNRTGSRTGIERSDIVTLLKTPVSHELPSAGSAPARAANQGVPFVQAEPRAALTMAVLEMVSDLAQPATPVNRRAGKRTWAVRSK